MCLAEFATTYATSQSKLQQREDVTPDVLDPDENVAPQYITLSDGKKMVKRKKPLS